MKNIVKTITLNPSIDIIFCDFFDTLVHRTVHPNYVYKLWGKYLILELGLNIKINDLYKIRQESLAYISTLQNLNKVEIKYELVIAEIYKRLGNNNIFPNSISLEKFIELSSKADYESEISVQFTNKNLISELRNLKKLNKDIYLVSDFYLSKSIFIKLLKYHGIEDVFNEIYISCAIGFSKENGSLYEYVLKKNNFSPEHIVMIGDNKKSDIINSTKYGIKNIYLKHTKHKIRNKLNLFGDDTNDFNRVLKNIERTCKRSNSPYSQYIIFFTIFIERLYKESKRNGLKDIFFLAREGHFLKQLFDYYQSNNSISSDEKINTHYFKISRQSAMQFALKDLQDEKFKYLEQKYGNMSLRMFLKNFLLSENQIAEIVNDTKLNENEVIEKFVTSNAMSILRKSPIFKKYYENNRINQKENFDKYLQSFNVNLQEEGMTIVDVGWGGSMQQWLSDFFKESISVTGYYLGLKSIYDIKETTKRFGLNFSIYPNTSYSDTLLTANSQLYEQLLSAPHGSTLAYTSKEDNYTIEHHQESEKYAYDKYFSSSQSYMFDIYKTLLEELRPIYYEDNIVQKNMTDLSVRTNLFSRNKDLEFIKNVTAGFYQNIGNTEVGIVYKTENIGMSKLQLLKTFLIFPEKTIKYIAKIKPFLYGKNKKILARLITPFINSIYLYMKLNRAIRNIFLKKDLIS